MNDSVFLASTSGGTDVCSAFVGGNPLLPVSAGEIACRCLGCKVEAFDNHGRPLIGAQGELVVTEPMPSMPIGFWNDPDGSRYRATYFEDFPGVWRQGDWITFNSSGAAVITGRSDATFNRGGVRLGTGEFYSVVENIAEVSDSMVVHLEDLGMARGPGRRSAWIAGHLQVAIAPFDDRDSLGVVEAEVVTRLDPPLNLGHCLPSEARGRLSGLRGLLPRR